MAITRAKSVAYRKVKAASCPVLEAWLNKGLARPWVLWGDDLYGPYVTSRAYLLILEPPNFLK